MASLNGQTIASSYEQLLHTDTDGGGNGNTLVSIKDGDNGTTFGLKLATNKVEIIPGSDDANAFEVSQADGTAVFTVDSSTPSSTFTGDVNFDSNTLFVDASANAVGIGTNSPEDLLHIQGATASVSDTQLVLEGRFGGYGAGINFVSRTSSGGTNLSMAKITADGEAAFDTTASNQDAGLRFFTTLNGSSAEKMRLTSNGNLLVGKTSGTSGNLIETDGRISAGAGSSGQPTFNCEGDTNTGINLPESDRIQFITGGSEAVRIDSSGDVGIGDSSPSTALTSFGSASRGLSIKNVQPTIALTDTDTGAGHFWIANAGGQSYFQNNVSGSIYRFLTSDGEKLRITNTGNTLFGCTSFPSASVSGFGITGTSSGNASSSGSSTSAWNHLLFYNGNGIVGSISTSGSTTTYSTSSDYRLKENQVSISDGLTRLNQLKPYRFNFIADADATVDGFFAHEVAEIVPEAVTGKKDAVDDDGNIVSQGIDQSKLVPLLVKALQEADDKIDALTARIEALEA